MAVGGGNTDVMWFVEQTAWVADSGREGEILAQETAVVAATRILRLETADRREGGRLGVLAVGVCCVRWVCDCV